jgi:hypothetical protein
VAGRRPDTKPLRKVTRPGSSINPAVVPTGFHPRSRDAPVGEQGQRDVPHLQLRPHKRPRPWLPVSSVWRIPAVPGREELHGYHPAQKPVRLVRRALLASTGERDLVFDPFCGAGTTAVAAKQLDRFSWGHIRSVSTPSAWHAGSSCGEGVMLEEIRAIGRGNARP